MKVHSGQPKTAEKAEKAEMRKANPYFLEYSFLALVVLLSVTGFWSIYFGAEARPNPYHHLHVLTNFAWLFLLILQLSLVGRRKFRHHRKVGLSVLLMGPLLFATTALLSVHSAHKALVSGKGDFLIVQNVMVTLELGWILLLAFLLRKRRKLHGALLLSTAILFMGIALFFTLLSFVPAFEIEGPETFHRFASAAITGQVICLAVGLLFLARDWRNGWPPLLAGAFFLLNEWIRSFLSERDWIQPLTELVGSMSEPLTFIGAFAVLLAFLAATGMGRSRPPAGGMS